MALEQLLVQWIYLFNPFIFCLLFIFLMSFLLKLNRGLCEKLNLPPSPPKLPIIGNLHQIGRLPHCSLRSLSKEYGPLMLLQFGYTPTLIVSSAEMAREIMKKNETEFLDRPSTTAGKMLLYGGIDLVCAPYGEYWREMKRTSITELLNVNRVQSFELVREEEVGIMIGQISRSCSVGASIDLSEMVMELSNNIVTRCAVGRKPEGEDGKNKFGELTRQFLTIFVAFSVGDYFPQLGWMDYLTGLTRKMKNISREMDAFFDEIIDERLDQSKQRDNIHDKKDFLDLLLHIQKTNIFNFSFTRNNIKAIILDMFVAGTDTTATTIEWAMAELMKKPKTMKKAQEEVRGVVRRKFKVAEADINQMDYLKAVIKETLRLHPAAALIPRETCTAAIVKGYDVPPKATVFINAWAIQRDPKLWNKAEEFIPERFMNSTIDFKGQDYGFIPFGSGRRGCPGRLFGVTIIEYVVANLLYWYDWKLAGSANEDDLDMTEAFGITVNKKEPLCLVPEFHFSEDKACRL